MTSTRGHGRARFHRLQQRRMARAQGYRRPGAARQAARARRGHARNAPSADRDSCGSNGDAIRIFQRSSQDCGSTLTRRHDEVRSAMSAMSMRDGFVYLTDRATFMIISGGVNIYPQETENLLITHPKVADAAVFGAPNADLGEEVKAVVQLMPNIELGDQIARELIQFCRGHLAHSNARAPSTSWPSFRGCQRASYTSASCEIATGRITTTGLSDDPSRCSRRPSVTKRRAVFAD